MTIEITRISAALRRRNRLDPPRIEVTHPELRTPATTPSLTKAVVDKLKDEVKRDERAGVILVRWEFSLIGDKAKAFVEWLKAGESDLAILNDRSSIRYQGTFATVIDARSQAVKFSTLWDIHSKDDFDNCGNAQGAPNETVKKKFEDAVKKLIEHSGDRMVRSMEPSARAIRWPPTIE